MVVLESSIVGALESSGRCFRVSGGCVRGLKEAVLESSSRYFRVYRYVI